MNIKKTLALHLFLMFFFISNSFSISFDLVKTDGTICDPLQKILQVTGIVHDGTIKDIIQKTQKNWLRKPGTERWQMEDAYEELAGELWPLFNELGMLEIVRPQSNNYDYCIVLGGLVSCVRNRFSYALELWNQGIRFKELLFLVGQRFLDPELEKEEILCDYHNLDLPIKAEWIKPHILPTTETDMAKMVFQQTDLPQDFKNMVRVHFIDAPGKITAEGKFTRPTTADTFIEWLATNPQPGTILAISTQPFVGYQYTIAKFLVPSTFALEVIGKEANKDDLKVAIILDNLARWLYASYFHF